ncbi:hypothetical protein [Nocardioides nitrophenolicus]|uniref:hypothetical protein n=1 Tax=Nocardioides nitrophenolicus TaxID=60489 RepID=UPI00195BB1D6|nr:hypothetical protein [Nocardioides nitrophenolicus]MBM7518170.1 hypothetical protein [Nocardioides nitrophenolicus]
MTSRRIRRFALHYGEMVAAMLIGMAVLWPVWLLATGAAGDGSWLRSVSVETLVMATTMALPMAGWMRVRGHRWAPIAEMCAVMYAGFAVALPLYWTGVLDAGGLMVVGHVAMFVLMLAAMAWRWEEYAGCHAPRRRDRSATMMAS